MGWNEVILAAISLVTGGGITTLFTMRQSRAKMDIENDSALIAEYKILLADYKSESEKSKMERDALMKEINELKLEMAVIKAKMETFKTVSENAVLLKCENLNCKKRRPPLSKEALVSLGLSESEE